MKTHIKNHKRILTPKTTKTLVFLAIIINVLFVSQQIFAFTIIEVPLEEEIKESVLIIKGKLLNKYSEEENIKQYYYDRNGEIKESGVKNTMYTTFVFTIDEVLYGTYESSTIEVKMQGGCDETGICVHDSTNYNYDKNEDAIIFLKKIFRNEQYMSTAGSFSAFTINEKNIINRKYHQTYGENIKQNYIFVNSKGKIQTKEYITINELKSTIVKLINKSVK